MENQSTAFTEEQLDEIETRAATLYEYATTLDKVHQGALDRLAGTDVAALLATVRRAAPTDQSVVERVARHLAARDWLVDAVSDAEWACAAASVRRTYLAFADEVIALVPSVDRCTCRKAVHLAHHTAPVAGCPWCADKTQTSKEA
jgi:hypothetical protein